MEIFRTGLTGISVCARIAEIKTQGCGNGRRGRRGNGWVGRGVRERFGQSALDQFNSMFCRCCREMLGQSALEQFNSIFCRCCREMLGESAIDQFNSIFCRCCREMLGAVCDRSVQFNIL